MCNEYQSSLNPDHRLLPYSDSSANRFFGVYLKNDSGRLSLLVGKSVSPIIINNGSYVFTSSDGREVLYSAQLELMTLGL
jgi:hypothetical protein